MAEDAAKILQRWSSKVPPEVPKEEVEKVVDAYFQRQEQPEGKTGSHLLIVYDKDLHLAEQNGNVTGTLQGRLTFSFVQGKRVKAYQVKELLKAIQIKEEFNRLRAEQEKKQ